MIEQDKIKLRKIMTLLNELECISCQTVIAKAFTDTLQASIRDIIKPELIKTGRELIK